MSSHTPLARRSSQEQQHVETEMCRFFEEKIPFHLVLGLKVDSYTHETARISLQLKPDIIGNTLHQRLHGGAIATILDAAGGFAISMGMAEKYCDESAEQLSHRFARIGTIDMRVDYLRQGQGKRFIATGNVLRLGGRIATTQMKLENESGEVVAMGMASYVVS